MKERKCKSTVSNDQLEALKNLQKDSSLILKEADKGKAIVIIMDKNHNKDMVREQLNDHHFSKKLN